ncbi:MAG: thiamine phosphate synthase [Rhodobacterales bacterium]|nr:MAG: thiamine phosphate synthase [Rhodobacterales bacterium]
MKPQVDLSFYLVLDPQLCEPLGMIETARMAAAGGATAVQLRHKQADTRQMIELGRALQQALADSAATLVINDDVEAAKALNAPALHIGQGDMPVARARALIGPDMLLGLSVETPELAHAVDPDLVDYIGAGPVFATDTKPDHKAAIGFDGLAQIVGQSPVPVVAIGGLKRQHIAQVFASGAQGLAVVSAICGQPDLERAIADFNATINEVRP